MNLLGDGESREVLVQASNVDPRGIDYRSVMDCFCGRSMCHIGAGTVGDPALIEVFVFGCVCGRSSYKATGTAHMRRNPVWVAHMAVSIREEFERVVSAAA
jgi:hypothetical protein